MGLSVPNMIMLDINDAESTARQPITRERLERNISQGFMKKLGKTGNIVPRTLRRDNQLHTVIVQSIIKHGRVSQEKVQKGK